MMDELLELAAQPRSAGYTAIIIERTADDDDTDDDVWQEWIREDALL